LIVNINTEAYTRKVRLGQIRLLQTNGTVLAVSHFTHL